MCGESDAGSGSLVDSECPQRENRRRLKRAQSTWRRRDHDAKIDEHHHKGSRDDAFGKEIELAKGTQDQKVRSPFTGPDRQRQNRDRQDITRGFQRVQADGERAEHFLKARRKAMRHPMLYAVKHRKRQRLAQEEEQQSRQRDAKDRRRQRCNALCHLRQMEMQRNKSTQRQEQDSDERNPIGYTLDDDGCKAQGLAERFAPSERIWTRELTRSPREKIIKRKPDDENGE